MVARRITSGCRRTPASGVAADPANETHRDLLERSLGGTESELARGPLRDEREEVTATIEPVVVCGWDFSDRMAGDE